MKLKNNIIKGVLFDMDGILYDSMPIHVQAWHETMSRAGIHTLKEEYYLHEGRTGHATINLLFNQTFGRDATSEEIQALYTLKTQRFTELSERLCPMPGALEVLQKVKEFGWMRVIVTGSGQETLFENLNITFPGYFEKNQLVTAFDVKYGKPNPEPYLIGLQKANLQSNEAIVVENAPLGVEAAVAAGITTIAVNTGPLSEQVLYEAGAITVFPSMSALANWLNE